MGARNFEDGLPVDGPLYAHISESLAKRSLAASFSLRDAFRLTADLPDFQPSFVEHPPLGFWTLAAVFRFLPPADWSARIPGHFYYFGFLLLFFAWLRQRGASSGAALVGCLLLLATPRFSNFFSAAYLDPGALFWGSLAVFLAAKRPGLAALALFLCVLQKGLTALGFAPALVFTLWNQPGPRTRRLVTFLVLSALLFALLAVALAFSTQPDFVARHLDRQLAQRFAHNVSAVRFFNGHFWGRLLAEGWLLLLLGLAGIVQSFRARKLPGALVPLLLFGSFVMLYAPNDRTGFQYGLMLFPWLAMLAVEGLFGNGSPLDRYAQILEQNLTSLSIGFLFVVAFIQYLPFPTHGNRTRPFLWALEAATASSAAFETRQLPRDFTTASPYVWYGKMRISRYLARDDEGAGFRCSKDESLLRLRDLDEDKQSLFPLKLSNGCCLSTADTEVALYTFCADT